MIPHPRNRSPGALRRTARVGRGAGAILALAALLSTGFVHRTIQQRRTRGPGGWAGGRGPDAWRAAFQRVVDEAFDERWQGRARHWRSLRRARRQRGHRYGRHVVGRVRTQRYVFGGGGSSEGQGGLSVDMIQSILRQHDGPLGQCLMRHGATSVHIDFDVKGNGTMARISLDVTGAAAACLKRVLSGVRFPRHPGTVTKGSYDIRLQ